MIIFYRLDIKDGRNIKVWNMKPIKKASCIFLMTNRSDFSSLLQTHLNVEEKKKHGLLTSLSLHQHFSNRLLHPMDILLGTPYSLKYRRTQSHTLTHNMTYHVQTPVWDDLSLAAWHSHWRSHTRIQAFMLFMPKNERKCQKWVTWDQGKFFNLFLCNSGESVWTVTLFPVFSW